NTINIQVGALKQARFETDYGPMTIEFFYEDAPRHVENFLQLAESGFYDNLTFHRIVEGYLIQGGAPDEEPDAIRPDGKRLEPEFNDRQFTKGTVAMARRRSDPNSASCQFFICGSRRAEWDGVYTAFGQLVGEESFATLDKIMGLAVGKHDRPRKKVYIRAVRTQNLARAE
ncbi:MAG: peptidylprolyl isomerase, partial [Planctomycetes bacterium]|nr:peptidylprolyl isomerase [Planctomycetota bacterium]